MKAVDRAGNVSAASAALSVTTLKVAVKPVQVPYIGSGTIVKNANVVVLNGWAGAGNTVTVYMATFTGLVRGPRVKIGTTTARTDGTFTFSTPPLAVGKYGFAATGTDAAGNVSPLPSQDDVYSVISAPPAVSSIAESPPSGALNAGKTVVFTLNMSDTVAVTGSRRLRSTMAESRPTPAPSIPARSIPRAPA